MRIAVLAIGLVWAAAAAAEAPYRVPWPEGSSYMFIQAPGGRITSHFTKATLHAVDIGMPDGMPVLAARAGTVEALQALHATGSDEAPLTYEGNYVRVRHADGSVALYAHLRHLGVLVNVGERVEAGQLLGYSGQSGDVTEPHLHFAVIREERNSAGWLEEVSLPIRFYVGMPAIEFTPRSAMIVTANYSRPADPPRAPSEYSGPVWHRPALGAGDEEAAWALLLLWLAAGIAALTCYWRFTRDEA